MRWPAKNSWVDAPEPWEKDSVKRIPQWAVAVVIICAVAAFAVVAIAVGGRLLEFMMPMVCGGINGPSC